LKPVISNFLSFMGRVTSKGDDFVNNPISALRFISLPLRRTASTPRNTRFARLDLGLFSKSSFRMACCEAIKGGEMRIRRQQKSRCLPYNHSKLKRNFTSTHKKTELMSRSYPVGERLVGQS
jgi:hypothetical protein